MCFELGNEPDLFVQAGHRQPGYGYDQYLAEFKRFADAVRRRVPGAPLAGPAVIDATDWVRSFAHDVPDSRLLTEHYYLSVSAEPAATIGNLLRLDDRFTSVITQLRSIGGSSGIPYRMGELNSFAGGGKPGVSDTFASALWGLDLMFTLAAAGGAGINWGNRCQPPRLCEFLQPDLHRPAAEPVGSPAVLCAACVSASRGWGNVESGLRRRKCKCEATCLPQRIGPDLGRNHKQRPFCDSGAEN